MIACATTKGDFGNIDESVNSENIGTAQSALTSITGPANTWTFIPITGTQCGDGTSTGVGVNISPVAGNKDLVIFFEGGGACWDKPTCADGDFLGVKEFKNKALSPMYVMNGYHAADLAKQFNLDAGPDASDAAAELPLKKPFGHPDWTVIDVFNRSLPATTNPYRDANWVIIPYCTGDVHVGDSVQTWADAGTHPQMFYKGAKNFLADLPSIAASFSDATHVTVMGMSAGGFGATAHAWRIINAFPSARVDVVSDSGPLFNQNNGHDHIKNALNVWNVADAGVAPPDCPECLTDLRNTYKYFSDHYPSSRLALLSWDADDVISIMHDELPFVGPPIPLPSFYNELASLEKNTLEPLPNVKYFIPSNGWFPAVQSSLPSSEQGYIDPLPFQNVEHTTMGYFNTTATTNNYNWWPGTPHTTKTLGPWLAQMYNADPTWSSISGQGVQSLASVTVAPTSYTVQAGRTYQFTARARDQNGREMESPPAITWTVSGGGTISSTGLFTASNVPGGPYTITASGGGFTGTASVTVTGITAGDTVVHSQVLTPGANVMWTNWYTLSTSSTIQSISLYVDTAGGTLRMGLYSCPSASTHGDWVAETDEFTPTVGWNTRNVVTPVATPAGKYCIAYRASSSALKIRWYSTPLDNSFWGMSSTAGTSLPSVFASSASYMYGGLVSVYANFGGTPNAAPTVATAAAASATSPTTTTTTLTALGADDGGEGALTYTWEAISKPSGGAVSFSNNDSNSAKHTVATFSKAGSYTLRVFMIDLGGLYWFSDVTVTATVSQTASNLIMTPFDSSTKVSQTTQFSATVYDQFGAPLVSQPSISWSTSGGGTMNASSGLFTAGSTAGGPYTVTATGGGVTNNVDWSVVP
jgi:hypothetical protein